MFLYNRCGKEMVFQPAVQSFVFTCLLHVNDCRVRRTAEEYRLTVAVPFQHAVASARRLDCLHLALSPLHSDPDLDRLHRQANLYAVNNKRDGYPACRDLDKWAYTTLILVNGQQKDSLQEELGRSMSVHSAGWKI